MSRRRRGLSDEDRELWSRYSRTADPLHPTRRRAATPESPVQKAPAPSPPSVPRFEIGQASQDRRPTHSLAPSVSDEIARSPLRMDAKTHRRMKSGKLRPEAKLDLHGMTLGTAQPELVRFILDAQARGKRLVIVVTGKGKHKAGDGPIPNRLGVLKHQVPQWLRMAPLATIVLQVTEAHRSHGGSGAYYVYLRR
ncbi:Smr domain protein [Jannaschia seosinensis]|uniref:Smr domain protein n=1 Tax=Jannaschia seosinensis TaxID=313367 RepID=A0A0M7BAI9_9RHOB|nr:Smr/MutS family protein [Jannaschia seosinensis]CUH39401.1 Smr domain protein [Jannaschia seosinensis]